MNSCKNEVVDGVPPAKSSEWVYVPVFSFTEISQLSPDEILEWVRRCHVKCGQLDILKQIDKGVQERGNPYIPKQLFPKTDESN